MMNRTAIMQALKSSITDEIVVASFTCAFDWLAQGERALNYFSYGAMGLGSSHGFGLALARPERKVVVLEGDGSLLMNLGTLVTIAAQAPRNLVLFNFQNNTYEANGGHPIPRGQVLDFPGIARSSGIERSFSIDDIAELELWLPEILRADGPTFVTLHVEPGGGPPRRGYEQFYIEERREALRAELASVR
jgi:thiamine pyrophosphate-dependent acetolactate synthase large subunit-like protein